MNANVIKEYLVSLGFRVDDRTYNNAMGAMKKFESAAVKVTTGIASAMVKGMGAVAGTLASVTVGTNKFMESVARADIETEKFARRMWMTEENARALQTSLEMMGESMSSIYDVAANPELRDRFLRLRADALNLEGGPEIDAALQDIREFQFEFERFRLLLSYGARYVAYYLKQYLQEPMERVKALLQGINDNGQSFAHVWGERIARFLAHTVRLFGTAITLGQKLFETVRQLPDETKAAMLAVGAAALIALNPFLALVAAIALLLLIYDDYLGWQEGKKSALGEYWEMLAGGDVDENSSPGVRLVKKIKDTLEELSDKVSDFLDKWGELLKILLGVVAFGIAAGAVGGLASAFRGLNLALGAVLTTLGFIALEAHKAIKKLEEIYGMEGYQADTVDAELANLAPGFNHADYLIGQIETMSQADENDTMSRLRKGLYMNKLKDVLEHSGKRTMDLPEEFVAAFGNVGGALSRYSVDEILAGAQELRAAFEQAQNAPRLRPKRDPFTGEIYSSQAAAVNSQAEAAVRTTNQTNNVSMTSNISVQSTDPMAAALNVKAVEESLQQRLVGGLAGARIGGI